MYVEQRERECRMNFNTTEPEVSEVNAHSVLQREKINQNRITGEILRKCQYSGRIKKAAVR